MEMYSANWPVFNGGDTTLAKKVDVFHLWKEEANSAVMVIGPFRGWNQ